MRKVPSPPLRSEPTNDHGAVMVLLAMLILVIIGFLALSVDTTLLSASRVHSQVSANAAVMGALERYGELLSSGENQTVALNGDTSRSIAGALQVASQRLGTNFNTKNPGWFFERTAGNQQNNIGICPSGGGSPSPNGCLRPIQVYFPLPSGVTCPRPDPWNIVPSTNPDWRPCACDKICECGENCPRDPLVTGETANGLKLQYRIDSNSPLRGIFRTIANVASGGTAAEVTYGFNSRAVLTPRNAIFLLDLSDSMITGNDYYKVVNTAAVCKLPWYEHTVAPGQTCNLNGSTLFPAPANDIPHYEACVYKAPVGTAPGAGSTEGDHDCVQFDTTTPVRIQGASDTYDGVIAYRLVAPEPLTSALLGINQAMEEFRVRKVPNDKIGVIGFDHERVLNRILAQNMASDLTIEPVPVDTTPGSPFMDFKLATATGGFPLTNPQVWSKYLFPRKVNSTGQKGQVYSDLPAALILARKMIRNTLNYRNAQNLVVMFSDGRTNCLAQGAVGPAGTRCANEAAPGNISYFTDSLALVENELNVNYAANKIAFDMVMVDSGTLPHELMWEKDGRCATQDEARSMGLPLVDTSGSTFYEVNRLFKAVAKTGGLWAPIRDCYRSTPGGPCTALNPSTLASACGGLSNSSIMASLTGGGATINGGVVSGSPASGAWPASASNYWDSRGRVAYDPYGRNTQTQISDYMNSILGKPPFMLETPNCKWNGDLSSPEIRDCCKPGACP